MEGLKIGEKQDLLEISVWNANVDTKLAEADGEVYRLQKWLDNKKHDGHARRPAQVSNQTAWNEITITSRASGCQASKPVKDKWVHQRTDGKIA